MHHLVVVNSIKDWPVAVDGCSVVRARDYLTDPQYAALRNARVYNLCRSYKYQSLGYYVSLLAAARGHKPLPSITTVVDFRNTSLVRYVSDDLDDIIQRDLKQIQSDSFTLSIYFGKNVAKRYDRLSSTLYRLFPAPFLKAQFRYSKGWSLVSMRPMATSEIPPEHLDFAIERAKEFFSGKRISVPRPSVTRYDIAILYDPKDPTKPSDERAIQKFVSAAEDLEMGAEVITKADYGRLAEFDALFIRETTSVNHHTFRFSRRAEAEGLVVVDDPKSILTCTNKVFLAESLNRAGVPIPRTMIVHSKNRGDVMAQLGLPCILKQPDSTFSLGVQKVETPEELEAALNRLFENSELIIAQEFMPTEFDWRVGVFDRQPLFASKYFMARHHWQIARHDGRGRITYGNTEALPIEQVDPRIIRTALKAASLIGDGLYGVDIKQVGDKVYVIEVNENPNLDAGDEDQVKKDGLYREIMQVFLKRLDNRRGPAEAAK